MRRWTVPVAAVLLTVFVGCGTASGDEKVNIQTALTPAAGLPPNFCRLKMKALQTGRKTEHRRIPFRRGMARRVKMCLCRA